MGTKPGRDHLPELLRALAEHPPRPSCSRIMAEGFWELGLSPCAGQRVENYHGAQIPWDRAGARRGEAEQGQAARKGSYNPVYRSLLFSLHTPIKVKPGFGSSLLGGSVHPGELSPFSLPHSTTISYSKAPCRTVTFPRPAGTDPHLHLLAPILFSRPRHTLGFIFNKEAPHTN